MTWFRVDDTMPEHPKWESLESDPRMWADCVALWTAIGCYSSRNTTDGHVSTARLKRQTPLGERAIDVAEKLVEVGLWHREGDGYRFNDWGEYNPTRAEKARTRKLRADRQRRWRQRKAEQRAAGVDGPVDDLQDGSPDASPDVSPHASPDVSSGALRDGGGDASGGRVSGSRRVDGAPAPPGPSRPVPSNTYGSARAGHLALLRGYQVRYESARGIAWQAAGKARVALESAGRWVERQAESEGRAAGDVVAQLLDGFFADDWAAERDWPAGALASQPGRYYQPPGKGAQEEIEELTKAIQNAHDHHDHEEKARLQARKAELLERAS